MDALDSFERQLEAEEFDEAEFIELMEEPGDNGFDLDDHLGFCEDKQSPSRSPPLKRSKYQETEFPIVNRKSSNELSKKTEKSYPHKRAGGTHSTNSFNDTKEKKESRIDLEARYARKKERLDKAFEDLFSNKTKEKETQTKPNHKNKAQTMKLPPVTETKGKEKEKTQSSNNNNIITTTSSSTKEKKKNHISHRDDSNRRYWGEENEDDYLLNGNRSSSTRNQRDSQQHSAPLWFRSSPTNNNNNSSATITTTTTSSSRSAPQLSAFSSSRSRSASRFSAPRRMERVIQPTLDFSSSSSASEDSSESNDENNFPSLPGSYHRGFQSVGIRRRSSGPSSSSNSNNVNNNSSTFNPRSPISLAERDMDSDEILARQLQYQEERETRMFPFMGWGFSGSSGFLGTQIEISSDEEDETAENLPNRSSRASPFSFMSQHIFGAPPPPPSSSSNPFLRFLQARRQQLHGITQPSHPSGLPLQVLLSVMDRDFNENDYEMLLQLDEGVPNNKGATQSLIESLPTEVTTLCEEELSCVICMCDIEEGAEIRKLPCGHKFHVQCIDRWLKVNKTCPIDKKSIDNHQHH